MTDLSKHTNLALVPLLAEVLAAYHAADFALSCGLGLF